MGATKNGTINVELFLFLSFVTSTSTESQLIDEHLPLVRRLALQLVSRLPANIELDDLLQAGLIGLLDAVRRYQPSVNAQFETYATARIRGAMLDELRSQDWLPRSVRSTARQIESAINAVQARLLRQPTDREIAAEMGVSLDEYYSRLEAAQGMQIVHLEDFNRYSAPESGESAVPPLQSASQSGDDDPLRALMAQGLRHILIEAIGDLPERERLLLSLQFEEDLNQKEIALVLGVSEGRVSQLRSQAIARIRAYLAARSWGHAPQDSSFPNLL